VNPKQKKAVSKYLGRVIKGMAQLLEKSDVIVHKWESQKTEKEKDTGGSYAAVHRSLSQEQLAVQHVEHLMTMAQNINIVKEEEIDTFLAHLPTSETTSDFKNLMHVVAGGDSKELGDAVTENAQTSGLMSKLMAKVRPASPGYSTLMELDDEDLKGYVLEQVKTKGGRSIFESGVKLYLGNRFDDSALNEVKSGFKALPKKPSDLEDLSQKLDDANVTVSDQIKILLPLIARFIMDVPPDVAKRAQGMLDTLVKTSAIRHYKGARPEIEDNISLLCQRLGSEVEDKIQEVLAARGSLDTSR